MLSRCIHTHFSHNLMSRQSQRKRKRPVYTHSLIKPASKLQTELDLLAAELAEYRTAEATGDVHPDYLMIAQAIASYLPWYTCIRTSHSPITPTTLAWATQMRTRAAFEYGYYNRAASFIDSTDAGFNHLMFAAHAFLDIRPNSMRTILQISPHTFMQLLDLRFFSGGWSRHNIYHNLVGILRRQLSSNLCDVDTQPPVLAIIASSVLHMINLLTQPDDPMDITVVIESINFHIYTTPGRRMIRQFILSPDVQHTFSPLWHHHMPYHPVYVQQFFAPLLLCIQRLEDTYHIQYTHRSLLEDIFELIPLADIYNATFH